MCRVLAVKGASVRQTNKVPPSPGWRVLAAMGNDRDSELQSTLLIFELLQEFHIFCDEKKSSCPSQTHKPWLHLSVGHLASP